MTAGVADTQTALWYLSGDVRLSEKAKLFIARAARTRRTIEIAPISLAEVVYSIEKGRLPEDSYRALREALDDVEHVFKEAPFDGNVIEAMRRISQESVPDMPDRIIAATALYLEVPLISCDSKIQASEIETVW